MFRKQHIAHQVRPTAADSDRNTGKFVDFAALRALEGNQTEASVGSWGWLRRKPTARGLKSPLKSRRQKHEQDLSPADRPIVIGIALPEDDLADRVISPETATLDTPLDLSKYLPGRRPSPKVKPVSPSTAQQQRSVWSPDTDDSPFTPARNASGAYTLPSPERGYVPPVPDVPSGYKSKGRIASIELDDDDDNTPITLFEEDGSPVTVRKVLTRKGHARSPATTVATRSGWWDHVNTPFVEQASSNPFRPGVPSPREEEQDEWWKNADEKEAKPTAPGARLGVAADRTGETIASSSRSAPSQPQRQESMSDKARILAEENQVPSEEPPPYEPTPPRQEKAIRYHAVFPPGHPLREHYPPSPGPISPGLANTMTSQGAISMTDVPLTPAQRSMRTGSPHLPARPQGSLAPGDHAGRAVGNSPAARIERQRRRHEKEDAVARRVEGFWKGRGCMPENGCYGRRGREGRKRRRICLGIFGVILALIILIVVLAVVLTRRGSPAEIPYSMWLNVTGFPPIPTGVTTVVGADNAEAVTGCVQPSTLWTCSLPKEEHQENEPFLPEQPKFIIQIQYDNGTRQLWNVPDGPTPGPTPPTTQNAGGQGGGGGALLVGGQGSPRKRNGPLGVLSLLRSVVRRADPAQVFAPGFAPQPSPPPFAEYYFLGNTTDRIASRRKAGEPTPFFISFLPNLNATVGPNVPTDADAAARRRRGLGNGITLGKDGNLSSILPPPVLAADGTAAPAVLRPFPAQQPLRLFDRGLPTEHFGFHTYFDKRHYVSAVDGNATTDSQRAVPADLGGGAALADARFVVTYTQTRFRVQIWTRLLNGTAALLGAGSGGDGGASNATRPGTFPYPITLVEDTHGGDFNLKGAFARRVAERRVLLDGPSLVVHDMAFGGTLVNHGVDMALGGVDGGDGGCKCAWRNWVGVSGGSIGI